MSKRVNQWSVVSERGLIFNFHRDMTFELKIGFVCKLLTVIEN